MSGCQSVSDRAQEEAAGIPLGPWTLHLHCPDPEPVLDGETQSPSELLANHHVDCVGVDLAAER